MSRVDLTKSVEERMKANWSATRVDYGGNSSFKKDADEDWVRLSVVVIDSENAEVGDSFQRTSGEIVVQCFIPINTGDRRALELADLVSGIFQNKKFGGVTCYATTALEIGKSGNWFQVNASTRFKYDVFS